MNSDACTAEPLSSVSAETTRRPPWLGLSILLLAGFVTIFDLFVVNVAIPSMQAELGASLSQIGFIVAGYELAFGVLLVTGGRLGDLYGRRRLFMVGMAGFTLASFLCGIAPTVEVLIGARVAQGLAAALLFPQVYASIRVNFSGDDSRRAFGFFGMTLGLAAIAGQIVGGFLVEANILDLGWRTIFLINVPIGAIAMLMARFIPETISPDRPALDWPGVALVSLGLTLLLVPLIEAPSYGWSLWSFPALAAAAILLVAFYRHQECRRKAGHQPLVDMALMRQPRFAQGGLLVLLIYSTASSFFLCFALLVQTGFGLSPFEAGSVFVPCSIAFVILSLSAPRLVARFGTPAIAAGALVYAVSFGVLIGQVWITGADLVVAHLIPALIVIGGAQAMIMTPLLNLVLGFVEEQQAGMASGVISTLQQVGAALGVAAVGILFGIGLETGSDGQAALYASAFVSAMSYNVAAAIIAAVLLLRLAVHGRQTNLAS
ncbi:MULTISPECIES: MFS transporter [Agrobacterium]|uniref:MFS transporter n=1 Tax=Agrobacterium TaxID=357 RepID=UPI00045B4031|nr:MULTISPECIES: MFS transporter [Agrobacterium]MDH0871659.1 MFS transporter [Agrobacterium pusense]TQN62471.1 MFS transporter [Agrobacterium tumefaciens]CDN94506.1 Arabinose efflux permease family protein [Agrobacterium tumefaciens]